VDRSFYRFVTIHAYDGQTDRQTDGQRDRQTEFFSLYRVCITCSAVKIVHLSYYFIFHLINTRIKNKYLLSRTAVLIWVATHLHVYCTIKHKENVDLRSRFNISSYIVLQWTQLWLIQFLPIMSVLVYWD